MLWDLIINRVEYDPEFTVHGIQKSRIKDAVQIIQSLYPWEWVKKRYKLALNDTKTQPTMDQYIDSDFWFPARLLARTAQGVICKDPGWNYLFSLAEGIKAVKKFPNGEKLLKSNAKSQGIVHQINFSGYLDKRGILTDVNQPTGSGNDKHDFAVKIGKKDYDIEMKALSSRNPGKTLKQEIMNRNCRLPRSPTHPIVYYVVLVESNISNLNEYENKTVKNFLAEITHDCFNESQKVAAIVVGEMFVDTSGGELKWSFNKFLINNKLKSSINELELRQIFVDNLKSLSYPLIPITFKLHLTKKP